MKLRKLIRKLVKGTLDRCGYLGEPSTAMCLEGLILDNPEGKRYTWQSGGCSCNHPWTVGIFYECKVPQVFKDLYYGVTPDKEDAQLVLTSEGIQLQEIYGDHEEAWVPVILQDGRSAVIVWNNSD